MNEDNRKRVYDVLKEQTGYLDSYEDFNKAFDASEDNRRRVYDVLKNQTGYLDSYEDFTKGMSAPATSVAQQVIDEYDRSNRSLGTTPPVVLDNPAGNSQLSAQSPGEAEKALFADYVREQLGNIDNELNKPREALPMPAGSAFIPSTAVAAAQRYGNAQTREQQDRYTTLRAARNFLDDANKLVTEAGKKGKTNFVAGTLRGLRDKGFDPDTWMMGISETAYYNLLRQAAEKEERGEQLSAEEQQLLDAAAVNMAANAYYAQDLGRGYKAGSVTAESIPFMLQFALNPVSGAGKGIAKTILEHGIKRFGLNTAKRTAAGRAVRGAARMAGDAVAAAGVTATTGLGNVAEDASRRMTGDVQFAEDADGNIRYAGRENNVGTGEAIARAFTSTFFENQSEMVGNYFAPVMRGISKFVTKHVPGVKQLSASKVGEIYRGIKNNPTYKEFTDRTQWHGAIGEYAEEVYNNLASVAMGDMTPEELVDLDNNIDTFLGVGLMSAVFGGIGAAGFARDRYTLNRDVKRFESTLSPDEVEHWQEVKRVAQNGDVEGVREFVKYTLRDNSLTPQEKKDEIKYIYDVMQQSAMENVAAEQTEDAVQAETDDIVANSDPQTNTYTECSRLVMNEVGEMVEVPGHIVGYMGGQPLWKPDGAGPEVEAVALKEGEYNPESVRSMPTQEVIDETAQAIREDAAAQAQRESTYSPDIVPPSIGATFTDGAAQYKIAQQNPDNPNGGWLATRTTVDEKGKPKEEVVEITDEQYYNAMQAQIDAQEQQTASQQATDGVSTGNGRRLDGTGTQQPLTPQQQEVETFRQAGVDEEVIRNTIADRVKKAKVALDKAERQAKAPVKEAKTVKEEMAARKKALDEARAVYEGWNALLSPEPVLQVQQTQEDAGARSFPQGSSLASKGVKDSTIEGQNRTQENQTRENLWELVSYLNSKYGYNFADEVSFVEWITSKKDNIQWLKDRLGHLYKESIQNINDFVSIQNLKNKSQAQSDSEIESTNQTSRPLSADEADALLADMESRAEVAPELELTIENWDAQFGADALVQTPIGEVKMGENQFAKMMRQGRNSKLGMVKPTLENPDAIIEDKGGNVDENAVERTSSYIFVKAFAKPDGGRYYYFTSVTVSKDGREVVISNQEKSQKRISKLLRQNPVAWINDKFSSHPITQIEGSVPLSETNKPTQTDNRPALLGVNSPELSEDKGTNHSAKKQASAVETIPTDEKGRPLYHRASVDATLSNINSKGLTPDEVDAFVQANKDAASKLLKKEEDKAPKMVTDLDKYVADKAAWQSRVSEAHAQVDYWNQVADAIQSQRTQVGDATAEDILSMGEPRTEGAASQPGPADDGVRAEEGTVAEGTSGGEGIENQINDENNEINVVSSQSNQNDTENEQGEVAGISGESRSLDGENEAATILRRAGDRTAASDGRGSWTKESLLGDVVRRSKESQTWIEDIQSIAGKHLLRGGENDVYLSNDGKSVIKVNDFSYLPDNSTNFDSFMNRVDAHNELFPNDAITVLGFTRNSEGMISVVLSQPYISNAREATQEEIDNFLEGMDFYTDMSGNWTDGTFDIADTKPNNVLVDADGNLHFIDVLPFDSRKPGKMLVIPPTRNAFVAPERQEGENLLDYAERVVKTKEIDDARKEVEANPTDAQKEAGNYRKGHITLDGYDITIENPKGSTRSGVDANGQSWSVTMNNDYGYIRGTEGVDGDHIDVFLSDDPTTGEVYVIDQVNDDGSFDEHKVMYGFKSALAAKRAYLANYSPGWKGLGTISEVSKDEFKKWVESSHRKTKPFAEYKSVKVDGEQNDTIKTHQPNALPGRLMKAYESGDTALIASVEQEMREFVNSATDMRSVYSTYLRSKDLERAMEKGSPSNKTQHFIAETCKDVLKKAGLPAKAMQSERARTEIAGSMTDPHVLDIMSADTSFNVLRAIIHNPNTSESTLKHFTKVFSNNGLDYEAQQELDGRKKELEQQETEKIKEQSGPVTKIEDVGEKIGGAKKDRFKEFVEKEKQLQEHPDSLMEELRKLPVSKIFNFNLEALRKDGLSNEAATLIDVIRRIVPSKPRTDWKLKRWVSDVFGLYRFCLTLATAEQGTFDQVLERATHIKKIGGMYRAQMALGGFDSGLDTGQATLEELGDTAGHYDKEGNWVSIKGQWYVTNAGRYGGIYLDYETAKDALSKFAGENSKPKEKGTEIKFSIYSYKNSGESFITPKGKPNIVVESGFKSSKEALDYLNERMNELQAKYRNMKDATSIGFAPNGERQGKDWRGGKDVTAEDFRNTFGFRGVEFGNWANQQERQRALNQAYDAFMDLSEATGVSPHGLSLGGELGMAFGARGGGGAAAHYEPGKVVINLTKTQGAGTLAHEWWHAIDNYFSRRRGQALGYNTERKGYKLPIRGGKVERDSESERKEITNAFSALMKAIDVSSYGQRSNAYASLKSSYWKEPTELGARAFAVWVERKLSEKGIVNNFLANNNTIGWESPELTQKYYPYPLESDFDSLDTAFDNLFGAIEEKVDEETGNTILYRSADGLSQINERFNEELQQQINGTLPKGHIYQLGMPSDILLSTGFPNLPIELSSTRLAEKAAQRNHEFNLADVKNLAEAIRHPLAVFEYGDKRKAQNIIVEIERDGKKFVVGVSINPLVGSKRMEVNSIRGIFPKDNAEWLNWISQGKMLYVDKKRIQDLIGKQRTNLADVDYLDLDSIAKIIENFENPIVSDEKLRLGNGALTDDELSLANDPAAKMTGRQTRTAAQRRAFAERERHRMINAVQKLAEKLHLDNVEIVTEPMTITDRQGKTHRPKGFYNPRTGKIVVVVPNNVNTFDVEQTLLHEAVAHYGLRQLFGEHFDTFLDNVYNNADVDVRRKIVELAKKNGWNPRLATEEYLASLAEETNFEDLDASWWRKIKELFLRMLHKIGFNDFNGVTLSDNELRYILWRSYENLAEPGRYRSILGEAADVVKQHELKVGNYAQVPAETDHAAEEANDLYRETPDGEASDDGSRETYNRAVAGNRFKAQEAYQDSMLALKRLQEVVEKFSGNKLKSYENAYMAENQMSSKSTREAEVYGQKFFKPMLQEVATLMKQGAGYPEIIDYMIAKHGLERNEVFAERDATQEAERRFEKSYKELEQLYKLGNITQDDYEKRKNKIDTEKEEYYQKRLAQHLEEDYSGLTALAEKYDEADKGFKANAKDMVNDFEGRFDTRALWERVNAATKETLRKSYESGMMSRDTYDKVSKMFNHYIPLRGWDEQTAEDVFEYLNSETSPVNSVLKSAKGRRSMSDDPLATIGNMAESAILQGNRNLMKQNFLNMAINHPTDVLTVREAWYVKDPNTGEWILSFPNIEENDDADAIARKVEEHEERMNMLKENGEATKVKEGLNIDYRISARQAKEHIVNVKRNGKDYLVFVNGNPRAAQAVNGMTNPSVETNKLLEGISRFNRQLAANFTNRNPAFVLSNLSRDLIFAVSAVNIKEGGTYARRFATNIPRAMRVIARNLRGKGDANHADDALFEEFLNNGGETGYTSLHSVDEYKRMVSRELNKITGKRDYFRAVRASAQFFSMMNRWAEDVSRFTTYMTSREQGKTISESVNDAKEVTVNFNKKGAGAKTSGVFGWTSGLFRNLYLFFNAAVQSLANFTRMAKKNPKAFYTTLGGFTTAGFLVPMLNGIAISMLGGDDDEDYYGNLPEWVRRNNLCLYAGNGKFITIPLPIELRAFYGLGEMAYQATVGKDETSGDRIAYQAINQITELLPINPLGNNGDLVTTLMPDVLSPFWQIYENKDFTGKPIYRQNAFNETMPEWTKAYNSTSDWLVKLSEWTNELAGGDKYKQADVMEPIMNWNPAKVEHLFESYFGGMAKTFNQAAKTLAGGVESVLQGEKSDDLQWYNTPVLNRFINDASDDRSAFSNVNERYYRLYDLYEEVGKELRGYGREAARGDLDYLDKLNRLYQSDDYKKYLIFKGNKRIIDRIRDMEKRLPEESTKEKEDLQKRVAEMKRSLLEQIDGIK